MDITTLSAQIGRLAAFTAAQGIQGQIVTSSLKSLNQMGPGRKLGSSLGATDWQKDLIGSRLEAAVFSAASQLETSGLATGLGSGRGGLINTVI
ncbi:MAG: hypothetical protein JRC92_07590 [Deltaproteobacteria bacterium]|nr:hypothetical protein [Deltaproteobacteria bacterium]